MIEEGQIGAKRPKYGSFQTMGLEKELLKGILSRNYKIPTPIQRKIIPMAMNGRDIVATARTGSGKTAAFLIPIFQKLKKHSDHGARALIILPTRDLAIQTLRFTKDIGKYCDLKYALIVGGDSIESHFAAIHQNPDIIIATPGRVLHVLVEMAIKLDRLEIVVFDEADRLFELGFSEQLYEILKLIPSKKQSLMLSATLPKSVIQFSNAGLVNPELIRLDIDLKFSPNLKMNFIHCKTHEYKIATLMHLLVEVIDHEKEKTLVFVSTKYHVEYLKEILDHTHIKTSISYSSMDNEARKQHLKYFRDGLTTVMVVTDIAARGLDIPKLDIVINFDFPKSPKLYIHRVGRVARMDKIGAAYSLFLAPELPYLVDLHTFMARDIVLAEEPQINANDLKEFNGITGSVPPSIISNESSYISNLIKSYPDILTLKRKALLAENKVKKFNQESSKQSVEYSKAIDLLKINYHPIFKITHSDIVSHKILHSEHTRSTSNVGDDLEKVIDASSKIKTIVEKAKSTDKLTRVSKKIAISRSNRQNNLSKLLEDITIKKKSSKFIDQSYEKVNESNNDGKNSMDVKSDFEAKAMEQCFNIGTDDIETTSKIPHKRWDSKKKRYVRRNDSISTKITNEHGVTVSNTFKSNSYKRWLNNKNSETIDSSIRKDCVGKKSLLYTQNKGQVFTPRQILKKRLKRLELKKKSHKNKSRKKKIIR